jgi:hypothetical protein
MMTGTRFLPADAGSIIARRSRAELALPWRLRTRTGWTSHARARRATRLAPPAMSDPEPPLDWLQNWYAQQCDGD